MAVEMLSIPLRDFNRHGRAYRDTETGVVHLTLPERMAYVDVPGIIFHTASGKETVLHLAVRYYRGHYRNPVAKAPVIQQFQPVPILNPLEPIPAGQTVYIPPVEYIEGIALSDSLVENPQL